MENFDHVATTIIGSIGVVVLIVYGFNAILDLLEAAEKKIRRIKNEKINTLHEKL